MRKMQRIIIVNNSRLVGDMMQKVIGKSPGLKVVSNIEELKDFPETVKETEADWAIILLSPDDGVPELVKKVLQEEISMRFLLMGVDGSHVRILYNKPHEVPLDKVDLQEILVLLHQDQPERIAA